MDWFEDWFDSKYYHILYKSRDYEEASRFISNLNDRYSFKSDDHILDLACGKGRHSIQLNKYDCIVTGIDLSSESIEIAQKSANQKLHFRVGDMRKELGGPYTHVLNLFTSFGYFNDTSENLKVFKSVKKSLENGGVFLIDFFNAKCVADTYQEHNKIIEEGIQFNISKKIENGIIHKHIEFTDEGKDYSFTEKVQLLRLSDFKWMAEEVGFKIKELWGDYDLNPYDETSSDRLIIEFRKA